MSGSEGEIAWTWAGRTIQLGLDRLGSGPRVLMLPALSSISTRRELRPLQERLADRFATVAVDWPGFGDRPRPRVVWTPAAYRAFLEHVLTVVVPAPYATVAAGHGAGYLLAHIAARPGTAGRVGLLAPTWRGPLPTMAGRRHPLFGRLARLADRPGVGALLYRLNVNAPMVRLMTRGHVYVDPGWLTRERAGDKWAVIRGQGARHAGVRFVTGGLDPFVDQDSFLAAGKNVVDPLLLVYGADTPRKSRAEMEALAEMDGITTSRLERGKLALQEEFPDAVAHVLGPWLAAGLPGSPGDGRDRTPAGS